MTPTPKMEGKRDDTNKITIKRKEVVVNKRKTNEQFINQAMSKTIEEIKDQEACNDGYYRWGDVEERIISGDINVKQINHLIKQISERYAQSQTHELTAWKESASKVFKNLDLQAIGKTLGIGLGEDVSTNVLPKIKELQEQNAELVMTLETIASLITSQTSISTVKTSLLQILSKYNHLNQKP